MNNLELILELIFGYKIKIIIKIKVGFSRGFKEALVNIKHCFFFLFWRKCEP